MKLGEEKAEIELIRSIRKDDMVANGNLNFVPKTAGGKKEWLKHYDCLPEELVWTQEDIAWGVNMIRANL